MAKIGKGRQTRRVLPNVDFKGLVVDLERSTINDEDGDRVSDLDKRIHALPQELFEEIRDLTFTCNSGTVEIDEDYQPSAQLSLCKASRERFAPSYYGPEATFVFRSKYTMFKWLCSLTEGHRRSIGHIHYLHKYPAVRRKVTEDRELVGMTNGFARLGLELEGCVLRVTVEPVEYESMDEIMKKHKAEERKWDQWAYNKWKSMRRAWEVNAQKKMLFLHP
ncbi:hypothetical protein LTR37_003265 [Vermiconidia calcicola]|uniref:Uncharacterized protein n=1 Tax=Vermiconidia calcicola TaxID=1690605 RepID=A0ACC3NTG4_9PEZI|nr:hypothetical protein LTR37_003265 [Vermiconidia calcicola]